MIFYLSTPFSKLVENLDFIEGNGFHPEIRMTKTDFLFSVTDSRLKKLRALLDEKKLTTFTHGPFFGLDIASLDRRISEYTRDCLLRGIEVTAALGGQVMVMHTGYLPYFSRGGRRHWFRNWRERMPPVVESAAERGVGIALENSWDDRPEVLAHLAKSLPGHEIKYCIDTGHINRYSRLPLSRWWEVIGERVEVVHLHDNDGFSDDHLAPGTGSFDFMELALMLNNRERMPKLDLEVAFEFATQSRNYLEDLFGDAGLRGGNNRRSIQ